jgi:hypothetical protein
VAASLRARRGEAPDARRFDLTVLTLFGYKKASTCLEEAIA